jgi:quinol monooxygenase YgiN
MDHALTRGQAFIEQAAGGRNMNIRRMGMIGAVVLALMLFGAGLNRAGGQTQSRVVRLAELEIEPDQLERYKIALYEEIDTSIRIEPGVLTLYAVALKDSRAQIRLFEVYADLAAYKSHLESAHFKKYKSLTQHMVKSLKLLETDPILLGSKGR